MFLVVKGLLASELPTRGGETSRKGLSLCVCLGVFIQLERLCKGGFEEVGVRPCIGRVSSRRGRSLRIC